MVIEPGMALCIHAGLRSRKFDGASVRDTVLVEEDASIPLHRIPETL